MTAHIARQETPPEGRYELRLDPGDTQPATVLSYRLSGATDLIAEHTWTVPAHRGKGLAAQVVAQMVKDAQAEGRSITALCSFVAKERDQHPDWARNFSAYP